MHFRWGGVCAALVLATALLSCGGGGGDGGGGGGDDIAVGLTTAGSATTVEAGGTLVIKANVTNTSSNMDVTWKLTGPNCPNNCGTITRTSVDFATYAAPAPVAVSFQVMVTATSIENPAKSGSVQLTVNPKACAANASLLTGPYAFLMQGFDDVAGKAFAVVGSLTADGCGGVTGIADLGPVPAASAIALSGDYSIGSDRRGTLRLNGQGVSKTFAIAVGRVSGGVAARAGLTDFSTSGNALLTGTMWLQTPAAFSQSALAGSYAYLLNGWGTAGFRRGAGGTVTLDAAGAFTGGSQDTMAFNGTPATGQAWSATLGTPSATTGRTVPSSTAFGTLGTTVIYVVSANQMLVLITDQAGNVVSGQMAAQSGPFNQASLQGMLVTNQTSHHGGQGYEYMTQSILALFSADGGGHLSSTFNDTSTGCNIGRNATANYTYQVASNGHVTVDVGGVVGGKYYLTRANTGFMLGFDALVSIGAVRPQSTGLTAASVNGTYFAVEAPGAAAGSTIGSGVGTSTGNGVLATTMDLNVQRSLASTTTTIGGQLADTGSGRLTDAHGNVIYLVAPSSFLVMNISGQDCYPVVRLFEN
jgi:hypothetical protein